MLGEPSEIAVTSYIYGTGVELIADFPNRAAFQPFVDFRVAVGKGDAASAAVIATGHFAECAVAGDGRSANVNEQRAVINEIWIFRFLDVCSG